MVDIKPLVTFRIVFGLATFISTLRFILLGWIDLHFIETKVQFKYFGFEWVPLPDPIWVYVFHALLLLASLGILFGAFYKLSTAIFFVVFTWLELIDITYYLNHYYFVSLVALLMNFLPANKAYSFDVKWGRVKPQFKVNSLVLWVPKLQLLTVYFFAGIAKINEAWLIHAMPLKIWLPAHSDMPLLGWFFTLQITPYIFSWAGMLFDVLIGYFLLNKKTVIPAWIIVFIFHSLTGYLFQIGVFPLVMILSTWIFFPDSFHEKIAEGFYKLIGGRSEELMSDHLQPTLHKYTLWVFILWFAFQWVFPFRYLAYPGNRFWTEQGYRFGWRVMLFEKAGTATFYVTDVKSGKEGVVDNRDFLNPHQEKQMAMQPDLILQYAKFLKQHYETRGLQVNNVRAEVYVTLNAAPSKLLFDPQLNLLSLSDSWQHKDWIYPW